MSYYVKITQQPNRIIELLETQVFEKTSGNNVAYHAELSPPSSSSDELNLIDGIIEQDPVSSGTDDSSNHFVKVYFNTLETSIVFRLFKPGPSFTPQNVGRLNRYLYDYKRINYTNRLPSWNRFGNKQLVDRSSISNIGNWFTYFFDGYIFFKTTTTIHFGITCDDDSFLWIIKGDRKWNTIGHPNRTGVNWISPQRIRDSKLVVSHPNNHGQSGRYRGSMHGSYTFQANTLYTILMKVTEKKGGAGLNLAISNRSLNNAKRRADRFPDSFFSSYEGSIENTSSASNVFCLLYTSPSPRD